MSFAKDVKRLHLAKSVVAIDHSKFHLAQAKRLKLVHHTSTDLAAVADADLVVLAVPVLSLLSIIEQISEFISPKTLVIDLGSTKLKIAEKAAQHFPCGNFIPCHPMAGREKSGPRAAVDKLFVDAPCIITPCANSKSKFLAQTKSLWKTLGAHVLLMPADEHDRRVAACSHLPHVLAFTLVSAVARSISPVEINKIAGKSFKAYSRVAGSDATMWQEIFLDNHSEVLSKIQDFKNELNRFESLIADFDVQGLHDYMKAAALLWRKL